MKIAGLTPLQIIAAIGIGIVFSFALGSLTAPHPVETPPIIVTPVPTPAPVYIHPTSAPTMLPQEPEVQPQLTMTFEDLNLAMTDLLGAMVPLVMLMTALVVLTMVIRAFSWVD